MLPALRTIVLLSGLAAAGVVRSPAQDSRPASRPARLDVSVHDGLRIVRVAGAPFARGKAIGEHFGKEIVDIVKKELVARYGRSEQVLAAVRARLPRRIAFPEPVREEIDGLWAGLAGSGVDLFVPELDRALDLRDLELVNALDVFATLGCSGFTVCGDRVLGGGVLTTRNFDWPYTGPHMVESAILLVVVPERGHAQAIVTWPGYFGAITAINDAGLAAFLHVGSGKIDLEPRAGSWPSACATRVLLERAGPGEARAEALQALAKTSPPASYITRVVLPAPGADGCPELVFETDAKRVVERQEAGQCVTTNHFLARDDGREASADSRKRHEKLCSCLSDFLGTGDRVVSISECWDALASVQRSGGSIVTIHSVVYRAEPWCLELAFGKVEGPRQVRGAPATGRRIGVGRAQLF